MFAQSGRLRLWASEVGVPSSSSGSRRQPSDRGHIDSQDADDVRYRLVLDDAEHGSLQYLTPLDAASCVSACEYLTQHADAVEFGPGRIRVDAEGTVLDAPALVTLTHMHHPSGTHQTEQSSRLRAINARQNAEFVAFDPDTGAWQFRVLHFSRYGMLSDDEEEGEADDGDLVKKDKKPLGKPQPKQPKGKAAVAPTSGKFGMTDDSAGESDDGAGKAAGDASDDDADQMEDARDNEDEPTPKRRHPTAAPHQRSQQPRHPQAFPIESSTYQLVSSLRVNPHDLAAMQFSLCDSDEDADSAAMDSGRSSTTTGLPATRGGLAQASSRGRAAASAASPQAFGGLFSASNNNNAGNTFNSSPGPFGRPQPFPGAALAMPATPLRGMPAASPGVGAGGFIGTARARTAASAWSGLPSNTTAALLTGMAMPTTAAAQVVRLQAAPVDKAAAMRGPSYNDRSLLLDAGLMLGRSFRVGWGPNGEFVCPRLPPPAGAGKGDSGGSSTGFSSNNINNSSNNNNNTSSSSKGTGRSGGLVPVSDGPAERAQTFACVVTRQVRVAGYLDAPAAAASPVAAAALTAAAAAAGPAASTLGYPERLAALHVAEARQRAVAEQYVPALSLVLDHSTRTIGDRTLKQSNDAGADDEMDTGAEPAAAAAAAVATSTSGAASSSVARIAIASPDDAVRVVKMLIAAAKQQQQQQQQKAVDKGNDARGKGADDSEQQRDATAAAHVWQLVDALWGVPDLAAGSSGGNDGLPSRTSISQQRAQLRSQPPHAQDMYRRRMLTQWLAATATVEPASSPATGPDANNQDSEAALAEIFNLLTTNNIQRACAVAVQNNDHRLALLIAQSSGPLATRQLLREQLREWRLQGADKFINANRLKIYALLAGCLVWPEGPEEAGMSVCEGLDWRRALAVHLWFGCAAGQPLTAALALYRDAFQVRVPALSAASGKQSAWATKPPACPPLPPYWTTQDKVSNSKSKSDRIVVDSDKHVSSCCPRGGTGAHILASSWAELGQSGARGADDGAAFDICYHLLWLYSGSSLSLLHTLLPEAATPNTLDLRLSWLLYQVLVALGHPRLPRGREEQLHASFAAQLEQAGLWAWAVFVLMHVSDAPTRERGVRAVVARHGVALAQPGQEQAVALLTERLAIPADWLHESAAVHAALAHTQAGAEELAEELLAAGRFNEAHAVVIERLAADLFLSRNVERLGDFITALESDGRSKTIQDWEIGGKVYVDFFTAMQMLDQLMNNGDATSLADVRRLRELLQSLSTRVHLLPGSTSNHRLCQAEMSSRLANALLVLAEADNQGGPLQVLDALSPLPLAGNYRLQHLSRLTEAYLAELES